MKKLVTTLFLLTILAVGFSTAQERVSDKDLAKWSIALKGGIDYYRVQPYATAADNFWWKGRWANYALQASWVAPMVNIEYTATRWFGVGLELGWLQYNRSLKEDRFVNGKLAQQGMYWGNTADAVLYGSVNLTNSVAPHRKGGWKAISLYVNGGVGGAWYHYKTPDTGGKYKSDLAFLGMVSVTTAFNVSKAFELFMEGQYRSYTKDNMSGFSFTEDASTNAITFLVGLRWKIGGSSKKPAPAYGHIRNAFPEDGTEALEKLKKDAEEDRDAANKRAGDLEKRVKALEDAGKDSPTKDEFNKAIKNLQDQIDALRKGGLGGEVDFGKYIKFNTGSHTLTPDSKRVLDEVFNHLNNDVWNTLEIFGYTDKAGSPTYNNQKLSERRAETVKKYLVNKGLNAAKIKTYGKGIRGYEDSKDIMAENRSVRFKIGK